MNMKLLNGRKEMNKQHSLIRLNNLVDPASSDMLVSKIKPCKCEYKSLR